MPFQSEKQRRYMHANLPDIANRWERDYAGGGLIPSHEAGIYGLNEGGRIGFFTGMREAEQESKEDTSSSSNGGDKWSPGVPHSGMPTTTTTTPDDSGDDDKAASYVNWNIQEKYTGDEDLEEQLEIDKRNALTRLKYDPNLTKNERHNLEVGLGLRKPKQPFNPLKWITTGALIIGTGGAALGLGGNKIVQTAQLINRVDKLTKNAVLGYNFINKTDFTREELFAKIQNDAKVVKETHQKKMDVYNSLPDGHPEKIALSVELEIGKKKTPPRDGPDDDKTKQFDSTITIDAEEVNRKKMELASYKARQQQKEDRSKQMAYWRAMMEPYMSAQGGRVPQGYNTGGLSNLFRLKNV